jgi:hypothetical protein
MNRFAALFFFFWMPSAFGSDCKVYGISDSPQKLACAFKQFNLSLSCKQGVYFIDTTKVDMAFHMEVEEGPVPLVFRAPDLQLTVMINSPRNITAELEKSGSAFTGTCR